MDDTTVIGIVVTAIVVPVVTCLCWLFKHIFQAVLPSQQSYHQKALDSMREFYVVQSDRDREAFTLAIAELRRDFREEMVSLRRDLNTILHHIFPETRP